MISRRYVFAAWLALPLLASAQAWPSKPVRIIVPTSPGGLTDLLARNLGQAVAESLQWVVGHN